MTTSPLKLQLLSLCSVFVVISGCSWMADRSAPPSSSTPTDVATNSLDPSSEDSLSSPHNESQPGEEHSSEHSFSTDNTHELPPGQLPPDIVPATTEANRLPQIQPGRSDPFEPLPTTPQVIRTARSLPANATPIPSTPLLNPPQFVSPIPIAPPPPPMGVRALPTVPLSPLPQSQTPPNSNRPAPTTLPPSSTSESAAPPSSSLPSNRIEFTGVVQVGDRINLIIEGPGNSGSRYIQIGDTVANGQYVVKAVDFNRGPDPAVILDRAGTEIVHWVGSSLDITASY